MIYGYARCSTNENKQDIDRQIRDMKSYGVNRNNIYLEYESGTKVDRVEYNKLLSLVKAGDTIVSTEISRLTRSTKQLCELIELVQTRHIKLIIANSITVDCSKGEMDAMTKAFLQMSGVFAELERNMISARVKSGMANAKAKGKQIGRKETTKEDVPNVFYKHYNKYKTKQINVSEFARLCSMSRTTIYKYIKIVEG